MVVGYRPPTRPEALFVWQVGVDPDARGRRLGLALLLAFERTPGAAGARYLEATVAPENAASMALFTSFSRARGAELVIAPGYALFPPGHSPERLVRIGPLAPAIQGHSTPGEHR